MNIRGAVALALIAGAAAGLVWIALKGDGRPARPVVPVDLALTVENPFDDTVRVERNAHATLLTRVEGAAPAELPGYATLTPDSDDRIAPHASGRLAVRADGPGWARVLAHGEGAALRVSLAGRADTTAVTAEHEARVEGPGRAAGGARVRLMAARAR